MRRAGLGLAITALFLALLARQVNMGQVAEGLRSADYVLLLAGIPFYFAAVWVRRVPVSKSLESIKCVPVIVDANPSIERPEEEVYKSHWQSWVNLLQHTEGGAENHVSRGVRLER